MSAIGWRNFEGWKLGNPSWQGWRASGAVSGLWTPELLVAEGWYDSSDLDSITHVGGDVSQLDDISGKGNHLTQGSASEQPKTGTRTIGGLNALDFDGIDDVLDRAALLPAGSDAYTYIALWHPDTTGGARTVMEQASGGGGRRASLLAVGSNYGFNGEGNDAHNLVPYSAGSDIITTMRVDNDLTIDGVNNIFITDNGTEFIGKTGNPAGLDVGTDRFTIGEKVTSGSEHLNGLFAEGLVINRIITVDERQKTEGYFAWKWGLESLLPIGHPYKEGAPLT